MGEIAGHSFVASVYPNPVTDQFAVEYKITEPGPVNIQLIDINGKLISQLSSQIKLPGEYNDHFKIPFNLNPGIYFIEIATESGNSVKRILVQQ